MNSVVFKLWSTRQCSVLLYKKYYIFLGMIYIPNGPESFYKFICCTFFPFNIYQRTLTLRTWTGISVDFTLTKQFLLWQLQHWSRDGSVGIRTWLWTGRWGLNPGMKERLFPFSGTSRLASEPTQPLIQWVPGSVSWKTSLGLEVNHLPQSSWEVKKWWSYAFASSSGRWQG